MPSLTAAVIELTEEERERLESWARRPSSAQALAQRARIILAAVVEHDPARPWLVVGDAQHLEVELTSAGAFAVWASERWPPGRFTVTLDPGQQEQRLRFGA